MRAYDGQRSDNMPIKRNTREKEAQLRALQARLESMKSHESPVLRASMETKIAELRAELGARTRP